jgi:hypothetical protein
VVDVVAVGHPAAWIGGVELVDHRFAGRTMTVSLRGAVPSRRAEAWPCRCMGVPHLGVAGVAEPDPLALPHGVADLAGLVGTPLTVQLQRAMPPSRVMMMTRSGLRDASRAPGAGLSRE